MKKIFFIWIIILVSVFFVSSAQNNNEEKISEEVYMNLDKNDEVNVIVKIKEPETDKGFLIKTQKIDSEINLEKQDIKEEIINEVDEENIKHVFDDYIAASISKDSLKKLNENPNVEAIEIDKPIKAFLQDSVPLVNATNVWPIQISGINITGNGETICILDTGINFIHPDLIGKNRSCVIDCYNKDCVENCSVGDDNGHGTHVAGIAAASGGIDGVSIGVNLIGVKVLDSNGEGASSDLDAGIDWCIANAALYNISVISLSLGTETPNLYSSYCDASYDTTAARINNATSYNISVIAATGNNGDFTAIASPACIENTTAVGWANKDDTINDNSNRNSITDLIAPGTDINSTWINGEYNIQSGTSMAAPHVSAAFALVRQFFRLQNSREAMPSEIQNVLNDTGKLIADSQSGLSFSRIDVFSALISLDNTAPEVNLILPQDNSLNTSRNQIFSCNATDSVQLENITLEIWKLGNLYYNETKITSERFSEIEFNTTLDKGNYEWNCLVYDYNNFAFASSNFSLYITNISVYLTEPLDNTLTNQQINFSCLSQTDSIFNLINVTFSIWNSAQDLVYNATEDISGTSNSTIFEYNFSEDGSYVWNCLAYNNETEAASAGSNFIITYDATAPIISGVSSSPSTTTATIIWTTNESSNSSVNYGIDTSLGGYSSSSILTTSHSISLSGLSSSTLYYYNVSSCDEAGNCQINGSYSFTTSSPTTIIPLTGSGGTTTIIPGNMYTLTAEQASQGYTKELKKDDKIKFAFFDEKAIQHTLTIDYVGDNFVNITLQSNTMKLMLGTGQSAKINLTSADYYDLYVKLNSIKNNKAELTIQTIHEEIPKPSITGEITKEEEKPAKEEEKEKSKAIEGTIDKIKNILIIVLIAAVLILLAERIIKEKGKKWRGKKK